MTDLQIIRTAELAELLSVSKMTIHRMTKRGELPPKIQISKRAVGWKRQDIEEFLEERTATEAA